MSALQGVPYCHKRNFILCMLTHSQFIFCVTTAPDQGFSANWLQSVPVQISNLATGVQERGTK